MSGQETTSLFNYMVSIIPQLVTIVAAIVTGFKYLQIQNNKKIDEAKEDLIGLIESHKKEREKEIKQIYISLSNLDNQYKLITGYIKENLERHERMLERLDDKNISRYGERRDIDR